jgi:glycosyltransferase involved in cell wall biosynthesis
MQKTNGGYQCTNRNYLSYCELLGSNNVKVIYATIEGDKTFLKSIVKRINQLFGFSEGVSRKKINRIIEISKEYDYVFIDRSIYGVIAYYLKKYKYRGTVICFFHNVEYKLELQRVRRDLLKFQRILLALYNERKAFKYSDKIVVLNKRDGIELQKLYGEKTVNIIPISFSDTLAVKTTGLTSIPPVLIFVGKNWFPNIQGLRWFIKNVLDHVNIKLQIVGSGMEVYKDEFTHPKIEFLGFVPDLSSILMNADYVISPIFIGGGMKVKTCEALMYGKNIIGTNEAFEGYEIDYQKIGALCNNKEEFIGSINQLSNIKRNKFNEYSRQCFLEKYSFEATLKDFENLLHK